MDWKDEEVEDLAKRAFECSPTAKEYAWVDATEAWKKHARDVARVVATRAVELAAARGGTMTAEEYGSVETRFVNGEASNEDVGALLNHANALGARNAEMEARAKHVDAEAARVAEERDVACHLAATWLKDRMYIATEMENLKERLSVAEEEVKRLSECAAVTETMAARRDRDEARAEADAARERLENRAQELKAEVVRWKVCAEGNENAWRLADGRADQMQEERDELRERLSATEEGNREFVRRAQQAEALVEHERRNMESWRLMADRMRVRFEYEGKRAESAEAERDELKARCATLSAAGQALSAHVDKTEAECCHPVPRESNGERLHTLKCKYSQRYPCSTTCTHDDAATPGHPERVKERSEAVNAVTGAPDPVGALAVKAGAKPGREIASYRAGYEQGCDDMRAACLEAALAWAQVNFGMRPQGLKDAIEGAVP